MKRPIVINLTGAPGAGKSTGASYVFSVLKQKGYNVELVNEFAKDKTWEHNSKALNCQEYVLGKQSYRLARCRDDVDIIITDSPLPLAAFYNTNNAIQKELTQFVMAIFNTYENINFFINRVNPYNPKGRNQTEQEANKYAKDIKNLYDELLIPYTEVDGCTTGYDLIVDMFESTYSDKLKENVLK